MSQEENSDKLPKWAGNIAILVIFLALLWFIFPFEVLLNSGPNPVEQTNSRFPSACPKTDARMQVYWNDVDAYCFLHPKEATVAYKDDILTVSHGGKPLVTILLNNQEAPAEAEATSIDDHEALKIETETGSTLFVPHHDRMMVIDILNPEVANIVQTSFVLLEEK